MTIIVIINKITSHKRDLEEVETGSYEKYQTAKKETVISKEEDREWRNSGGSKIEVILT